MATYADVSLGLYGNSHHGRLFSLVDRGGAHWSVLRTFGLATTGGYWKNFLWALPLALSPVSDS